MSKKIDSLEHLPRINEDDICHNINDKILNIYFSHKVKDNDTNLFIEPTGNYIFNHPKLELTEENQIKFLFNAHVLITGSLNLMSTTNQNFFILSVANKIYNVNQNINIATYLKYGDTLYFQFDDESPKIKKSLLNIVILPHIESNNPISNTSLCLIPLQKKNYIVNASHYLLFNKSEVINYNLNDDILVSDTFITVQTDGLYQLKGSFEMYTSNFKHAYIFLEFYIDNQPYKILKFGNYNTNSLNVDNLIRNKSDISVGSSSRNKTESNNDSSSRNKSESNNDSSSHNKSDMNVNRLEYNSKILGNNNNDNPLQKSLDLTLASCNSIINTLNRPKPKYIRFPFDFKAEIKAQSVITCKLNFASYNKNDDGLILYPNSNFEIILIDNFHLSQNYKVKLLDDLKLVQLESEEIRIKSNKVKIDIHGFLKTSSNKELSFYIKVPIDISIDITNFTILGHITFANFYIRGFVQKVDETCLKVSVLIDDLERLSVNDVTKFMIKIKY